MRKLFLAIILLAFSAGCYSQEFTPIFNGVDLSGWKQISGKAKYYVENGCIVGESHGQYKNSFLATEKEYSNYILEFEFKSENINSGVQFRSRQQPWYYGRHVYGYQYEIDPINIENNGSIYYEHSGWLYKNDSSIVGTYYKNGWNSARIEVRGKSIKTYLNGAICSNIINSSDSDGFIALQVHLCPKDNDGRKTYWRNIKVCELCDYKSSRTECGIYTQAMNPEVYFFDYPIIRKLNGAMNKCLCFFCRCFNKSQTTM